MAISMSIALGKSRKSAGNVTFRRVRGRTVVSEKIGPRGSATRGDSGENWSAAQLQRMAYFGMINKFARLHSASINASFTRTRYGSSRNAFVKKNYAHLVLALEGLAGTPSEAELITAAQVDEAITAYATANPTSIIRIDIQGEDVVYLTGAWTAQTDPDPSEKLISVSSISIGGSPLSFGYEAPGVRRLVSGFITITGQNLDGVTGIAYSDTAGTTVADGLTFSSDGTSTEVSFFYNGEEVGEYIAAFTLSKGTDSIKIWLK